MNPVPASVFAFYGRPSAYPLMLDSSEGPVNVADILVRYLGAKMEIHVYCGGFYAPQFAASGRLSLDGRLFRLGEHTNIVEHLTQFLNHREDVHIDLVMLEPDVRVIWPCFLESTPLRETIKLRVGFYVPCDLWNNSSDRELLRGAEEMGHRKGLLLALRMGEFQCTKWKALGRPGMLAVKWGDEPGDTAPSWRGLDLGCTVLSTGYTVKEDIGGMVRIDMTLILRDFESSDHRAKLLLLMRKKRQAMAFRPEEGQCALSIAL
jgi:hypothetical protein